MYLAKKESLKSLLSVHGTGRPSATTDLWTSGNQLAMMSVTLSWLDQNFEMCEAVIGYRKVHGRHTGSNIASVFLTILREYGIDEKVLSVGFR